uniref:Retrotransposon protein n=1 Tax=Cucumis melo TaxID=3656 RepID=A0A9I9D4Z6_CUCME
MVGCSLTTTVIKSRIKLLKKTFQAIAEMRGPTGSCFGWNDDVKCIIIERDVFDHWVQMHPAAKRLLNKPFLHYNALSYVFEKDQATGAHAETFADIDSNMSADYDSVPTKDGIDMEFPVMCSPRMNMSPKDMMGGRSGRSSDGRTGSSEQKRKHSMQQFETYDLIRECMEAATDQLRTIAEWPKKAMSWEDTMAAQVIELIKAIPNLTMAEKSKCVMLVNQKVSLMRSFIKMPDLMKAAYCRVLLGGDP